MKKMMLISIVFMLLGQPAFSQKKTTTVSQKFFEVDQDIETLRKELSDVRKQMRELEIRVSIPEIRKEINNLIQLPEMTHEIILNNGTVVKGKIIHEDMDRIVIQTQIGQLTLSKNSIKLTRKADLPKAN
ncbi:MAG: hypothetical protein Q7J65_04200, partial [Candidatus Marinimicrobia bacterium]|nr:hypothetical protein [Candidatus Neomarinimicrobiota bacterium]